MHALTEAATAGHNRPRNAGVPLDPAWFEALIEKFPERRKTRMASDEDVLEFDEEAYIARENANVVLLLLTPAFAAAASRRRRSRARRALRVRPATRRRAAAMPASPTHRSRGRTRRSP